MLSKAFHVGRFTARFRSVIPIVILRHVKCGQTSCILQTSTKILFSYQRNDPIQGISQNISISIGLSLTAVLRLIYKCYTNSTKICEYCHKASLLSSNMTLEQTDRIIISFYFFPLYTKPHRYAQHQMRSTVTGV